MIAKTRILIVEDNPNDLELIQYELKKGGISCAVEVVQTEEDYEHALGVFAPDVILSDFALPSFNGPTAFKLRNEKAPETPFIFVSGTIGEENSIEYIKSGVTDYVLKDKLFTLCTKVERALRESNEKELKNKIERERILSEARLREAQTIAHIGSWEIDMVNDSHHWSDELFDIFGEEKDSRPSKELFLSFVHVNDLDFRAGANETSFETQRSFDFQFVRRDGAARYGFSRYCFEFDANGNPVRLYGIIQDITEKKIAEEKIRKANRLYGFISQVNQTIVHTTDEATLFRKACDIAIQFGKFKIAWIGMFDHSQKVITLTDHGGIPHEDVALFKTVPYVENGPQDYVLRSGTYYICNDLSASTELKEWQPYTNKWGVHSVMVLPIKKLGQIIGTFNLNATELDFFDTTEIALLKEVTEDISFALDIFEKEKRQRETESYLRLLESVITHANDAILITEAEPIDEPGPKIVYVNRAFTKMTGYSSEEVMDKNPRLLQGPKTDRHQLDNVRNALLTRVMEEVELINYKKNGDEFWNNFTIVPVMDSEGKYTHSVSIQRDATSRRQAEEITRMRLEGLVEARTRELNIALANEKQLVELRNNFISVASHEFRTPLSTISLAAGFVRKYHQKMKSLEIESKMASIERQVSHMTHLLDDVLVVGKATAGKIEVKTSLISVDFLEQLAREVVGSTSTKHHLTISSEGTRKTFHTDQKLIRAIIINLITNAIKFSPDENSVLVNFTCTEQNLVICVRDFGIGIPAEDLKNLFSAFSRGSNAAAIEGTGLGLSIVKNACDLLKGSILVKSELGRGTEINVTLPLIYD